MYVLEIAQADIITRLLFDNPWQESSFDGIKRYQDMHKEYSSSHSSLLFAANQLTGLLC